MGALLKQAVSVDCAEEVSASWVPVNMGYEEGDYG